MSPPSLSGRDYRALARFRHDLRLFLSFSETAPATPGSPRPNTSCCWP